MAIDLTARLSVQDKYSGKLQRATKQTKGLDRAANGVTGTMKKFGGVLASVGAGFTLAAATTSVVRLGSTFDTQMSQVQAVSGATAEQMSKLEDAAKAMGSETKYNASQAAEAQAALSRAGFSTEETLASLEDTLNLAAAGGIELGRSADIASNVLSSFNMEADEMSRVSDVMAKAASSVNTNIDGLAGALEYVGPIAQGLGQDFEGVSAAVGILSNNGIKAEKAGTALRGMFGQLQNVTGQTKEALDRLGISAGEVNPSVHSLSDIIKTLKENGATAADAMQLVGTEAGPGLAALLTAGSGELDRMTQKLRDSGGAAKEMSETMQNNLAGAWTKLTSKAQAFGLSLYEKAEPALRSIVEWGQRAADVMNAFVSYMSGDSFSAVEKLTEVFGAADGGTEKVQRMMDAFKRTKEVIGQVTNTLQTLWDKAKQVGQFIKDNWSTIRTTIKGVAAAFLILKGAAAISGTIMAVTKAMKLWRTATLAARLGMLGLNGALWASPITWWTAGILAMIAVGYLVVKNWDKISAKAKELWGVVTEFFGKMWSKTKEIFGKIRSWVANKLDSVWSKVRSIWDNVRNKVDSALSAAGESVSNFFSPLISFIDDVKGKWQDFTSMLSNFSMPESIKNIGGAIGSAASTVGGWFGADGSHATGLNYVPKNNYKALLHEGEMIVPKGPADMLRDSGFTKDGFKGGRGSGLSSGGGFTTTTTNNNSSHTTQDNSVHIAKLADEIVVREDADIDKIADKLAHNIRLSSSGGAVSR